MAKPILLVDDNPTDVELAMRAFEQLPAKFKIEVARDGLEALERLGITGPSASLEVPGLMLLDIQMPRMDGFQVLERVRAEPRFAGVYIAILTSSSRGEDKNEALRLGADCYIEKPMDFSEFITVLEDLTAKLT